MTLKNAVSALVMGALTLSSCVLAGRAVNRSSARCQVVSMGQSQVSSDSAVADVSADASAFICNGEIGEKTAESIANATATAFARAVATAAVDCELQGNAHVQVDAKASAVAAANVWLSAYAEASAHAGDCDKCEAWASSWGYVAQEVFLKAVAEVQIELDAQTTEPGPLIIKVIKHKEHLEKAVVFAFAEALARAHTYQDTQGCMAFVNTNGCIYSPENIDPEYCFECKAEAVSVGVIQEIDAIAEASASASAWTCGESVTISQLETTASALAQATAQACSYSYASCEVDGGYACTELSTNIKQIAHAVAEAYADTWVGAYVCEDPTCTVSADIVTSAIGDILAEAASEALAYSCLGGGSWTVKILSATIAEASLCALAEASAYAISQSPSTCLVEGITYAEAEESSCPAPALSP